MRKLLLAVLVAGCSSSSPDNGAAHVGATWQIKDTAGQVQGCPTGFDTAALVNQPVDSAGNNVGSPIIDLFDCAAGAGTSAALPATTYVTFVQITDHSGATVYAKSVPATLDVTTTDLTYNTDILTDGGYFAFAWVLTQGGSQVSCSQAGVTGAQSGVDLTATLSTGGAASDDEFTCEDGQGVTSGLLAGDYTVHINAFTSAGQLGAGADIASATIQAPNVVTNLGTVMVPVQ